MAKKRSRSRDSEGSAEVKPLGETPEPNLNNDATINSSSRSEDLGEPIEASEPPFPIVGIGASAGGLEAFLQLLQAFPPVIPFPVVIVQHMSPQRNSGLPELLHTKTQFAVAQISDGMEIGPGKIFVTPPDADVEIASTGRFHLRPREPEDRHHLPIDSFFRSLAQFAREKAISVVLSGTASDGAVGTREIKAYGGVTIAQTPSSAKFDSMPRAAIATDSVDLVLDPAQMALEIVRIVEQGEKRDQAIGGREDLGIENQHLARIFSILRTATGVDFSHYKTPTIRRRLQRRMNLQKVDSLEQYTRFLQENPDEAVNLHRDILIHVTRFFREPESFETLKEFVFPKLLENRTADDPVRIWVPGCSTGEEAYSVAIALLEFLNHQSRAVTIQLFATDVSETAIDKARAGIYPESIVEDVTLDRVRKYFNRVDGAFQISKRVRDMCIFARQDLTRDPPFSRLDLVVCRNVLIYLVPPMQKKLMTIFHYGLRPNGFLMLGAAETVGPHSDLFTVVDKRHRLYTKKSIERLPHLHFPVDYRAAETTSPTPRSTSLLQSAQEEAKRLILEKYSPPGVIVDANLHITQFIGQTGRFLEPAPGEASWNLLKMAREGLLYGLQTGLRDARQNEQAVRRTGLHVKLQDQIIEVDVEVVPLRRSSKDERFYLVLFHTREHISGEQEKVESQRRSAKDPLQTGDDHERIQLLHQELEASREYLQTVIQDMEAANEELQSANEEILSSNEELQSTNEELDTAKEELQSTNEELNTVNEELHNRNEELRQINNDLINLLANVQIAIVMVDGNLRIRRFTPRAEEVLNLISSDVGRPIGHIKPNIQCPDLEELIVQAMGTSSGLQREVLDQSGRWLSLRIRPYRGLDNSVDGAVMALIDIDGSKRLLKESEMARDFAEAIVETIREPIVVLDQSLRIKKVNQSAASLLRIDPANADQQPLMFARDGQWQTGRLRTVLEGVLASGSPVESFPLSIAFSENEVLSLRLSVKRIGEGGAPHTIVLAFQQDNADS